METRLDGPAGFKDLYFTSVYSPESGNQPVLMRGAWGSPDGKLASVAEWQWLPRGGVDLAATFRRATYRDQNETLSFRQSAELVECTLNQPLDVHQFDVQGLGVRDGDVIVDHVQRTVSAWRDGAAVRLGDFVR